jgi:hypothetical protein
MKLHGRAANDGLVEACVPSNWALVASDPNGSAFGDGLGDETADCAMVPGGRFLMIFYTRGASAGRRYLVHGELLADSQVLEGELAAVAEQVK